MEKVKEHEVRTGDFADRQGRSRENWLAWVAVIGPVLSFILGACTGAAGTVWLYHDHEKRIAKLEAESEIYKAAVTALRVKGILK
jgi:hypothetical protein